LSDFGDERHGDAQHEAVALVGAGQDACAASRSADERIAPKISANHTDIGEAFRRSLLRRRRPPRSCTKTHQPQAAGLSTSFPPGLASLRREPSQHQGSARSVDPVARWDQVSIFRMYAGFIPAGAAQNERLTKPVYTNRSSNSGPRTRSCVIAGRGSVPPTAGARDTIFFDARRFGAGGYQGSAATCVTND
jgi:hypothetical protein